MNVKKFLLGLGGLLVSLIILMVILQHLKGVPVIGALAADAQHLAQQGTF